MSGKLALVCEGGGASSTFVGGAIVALDKELGDFDVSNFDALAPNSAAVGAIFYYLSHKKQGDVEEAARQMYFREIRDPKFISLGRAFVRKPVIDVDYMVDELYKNRHPLDCHALEQTTQSFFMPVYNLALKKIQFFTNNKDSLKKHPERFISFYSKDTYEIIRASNSIPLFYNKTTTINNQGFIDAGVTRSFGYGLEALADHKKLVILVSNYDSWFTVLLWVGNAITASVGQFLICRSLLPWNVFVAMSKKGWNNRKEVRQLKQEALVGRAFIISPPVGLQESRTRVGAMLEGNYNMGYQVVVDQREAILDFMKGEDVSKE